MDELDLSVLDQWRWDERIFPHGPVCPEHAEQDRVARAERTASLEPATAPLEAVGLLALRVALDQLRETHERPLHVRCHHRACDRELVDSIDIEWSTLASDTTQLDAKREGGVEDP